MLYRRPHFDGLRNLPQGLVLDHSHPWSRNLIGCFPLNEGGGSRITNHGRLHGTTLPRVVASTVPQWNSGKLGRCLRFPSGSYILPDTGISVTTGFAVLAADKWSVSVWVRGTDVGGTAAICGEYTNSITAGWGLTAEFGNPSFGIQQDGAKYAFKYCDKSVADGHWHHIVATCNGTATLAGLKVYIDGKDDPAVSSFSAGTITDFRTGISQFVIGTKDSVAPTANPYTGDIALLQFWKGRVISQQEARDMWQRPFAHFMRPMQPVIRTSILPATTGGNFFLGLS